MRSSRTSSLRMAATGYWLVMLIALTCWGCTADTEVQTPADSTTAGTGDTSTGSNPSTPGTTPADPGTGSPGSPSTTPPATEPNIRVTAPMANQTVPAGGFQLAGTARTFENSVGYRIRDTEGNPLSGGHVMAVGEMGTFNPFMVQVKVKPSFTGKAILEVYQNSAKDGSEIDKVIVPIIIGGAAASTDDMPVRIFLVNSQMGSGNDCRTVHPVQRRVERTVATAEAALTQLLQGPTPAEKEQGYNSEIPPGVRLNDVIIDQGTATVDFSAELNKAAGACRVSAIRAQIEQTLRQFQTVRNVVISVEGNSREALQP